MFYYRLFIIVIELNRAGWRFIISVIQVGNFLVINKMAVLLFTISFVRRFKQAGRGRVAGKLFPGRVNFIFQAVKGGISHKITDPDIMVDAVM